MSKGDGDYDVGYGRPPQAHRFKPGQSGNPKGRPKGARNFAAEIDAELNATVEITENGKKRKRPKRAVIAKQLVNKSAQGDPKATALLLQHVRQVEAKAPPGSPEAENGTAHDRWVMQGIVDRIRQGLREQETEDDSGQ